MPFPLTITKIDSVLFRGEALSVTLPGVDGDMTILAKHMPLIAALRAGTITVRIADGVERHAITGGFVDVGKRETVVLISEPDSAERPHP